jgi:Sec-independent protein translocase protein TatA
MEAEFEYEGRKQRGRQKITFESRIEEVGRRRGKTLREMKKMEELEEGIPDAVMAQTETEKKKYIF